MYEASSMELLITSLFSNRGMVTCYTEVVVILCKSDTDVNVCFLSVSVCRRHY